LILGGATIFNVRRLISHEAALIIDAQGITIRDYFPVGSLWLSWAEVAALSARSPSYGYLCIRLRNLDTFTANYHPIQHFFLRWNPSNNNAPITIPRAFLALSVPQILAQICDRFGDELNRYQISVQTIGLSERL